MKKNSRVYLAQILERIVKIEEQAFLRGVVQGLRDIEEGREISLTGVKKHLGLSE